MPNEKRAKLRGAGGSVEAVRPFVPDDFDHLRQIPNQWSPGTPRPFIPSHSFKGRDQQHPGNYLTDAKPGRTAATSKNGSAVVKNVIHTAGTSPKK